MLYAAAPCRRDPSHGAAARPAARCNTVGYSSSACSASPTSAVLALHTTGTASSRSARGIGTVQLRQPGRREKPPAPCAPIGTWPDNNSPRRISCACGPRSVIPRRHRAISPPLHVQAHSLRAPLTGRTSSLTRLRTVHPGIDASTSLVRPALAAVASTVEHSAPRSDAIPATGSHAACRPRRAAASGRSRAAARREGRGQCAGSAGAGRRRVAERGVC
jgi:hypothetical protein